MIIRVRVMKVEDDGTHVCELLSHRPGLRIRLSRGEASVLVEWSSAGPGEPLEISHEVAVREGIVRVL